MCEHKTESSSRTGRLLVKTRNPEAIPYWTTQPLSSLGLLAGNFWGTTMEVHLSPEPKVAGAPAPPAAKAKLEIGRSASVLVDGQGACDHLVSSGQQLPYPNWLGRGDYPLLVGRYTKRINQLFTSAVDFFASKHHPDAGELLQLKLTIEVEVEANDNGVWMKITACCDLLSDFMQISKGGVNLTFTSCVVRTADLYRKQQVYVTFKVAGAVPFTFTSLRGLPINPQELVEVVRRFLRGSLTVIMASRMTVPTAPFTKKPGEQQLWVCGPESNPLGIGVLEIGMQFQLEDHAVELTRCGGTQCTRPGCKGRIHRKAELCNYQPPP